jgi:3-hydroxymyristoyl/3-hydroxydecanoyl-(acyl carrier protein) dehydratase
MENDTLFGMEDILRFLPHRPPFLFVDRITAFKSGVSIKGIREIRADEYFFSGHFPGKPVMPGALILDALAQTSGLLWGFTREAENQNTPQTSVLFFLASANVKFINPSFPGDTLELTAFAKESFGSLLSYDVEASVGRKIITKGRLTLAMMKGTLQT